jgi:hypothetical protein
MRLPVIPRLSVAFRREAQACQVFLNRFVIAAHAIAAVSKAAAQKGRIRIRDFARGRHGSSPLPTRAVASR